MLAIYFEEPCAGMCGGRYTERLCQKPLFTLTYLRIYLIRQMTQGEEPSSGFILKKVPAFTGTARRPDPDHGIAAAAK
jgi:hypothetical protein